MRRIRNRRIVISVMSWLVLLWCGGIAGAEHGPNGRPALDPGLARYAPATQVSGHLKIAGPETMRPLLDRLALEFRRRHPQTTIDIEGGGSASGLKEFLERAPKSKRAGNGHQDTALLLTASSRLLTASELSQFASKRGYEPVAVPVAVDAVSIYVHRENPLPSLTLEQVDAIFSTTRHRGYPHEIKRWGQLGLANGWENARIRLYGRDQKSGTRAFIKEHVLVNGEFDPAVQEEPGAASVILAVSRDPFGIGYSGIGLQTSSVRAVPLAEKAEMPFVLPSAASIADGSYPLRRFLYLYLDKPPGAALQPAVQEFLAFVNSRDGQEAVIKAGFYPLPLGQVEQTIVALRLTPGR